jgi:hypothetical protein
MPFKIIKNKNGTYKVKNLRSGRITAKNTTLIKAKKQIRLIGMIVHNKTPKNSKPPKK